MDYRYYMFRLDDDGGLLNEAGRGSRTASDQRDAISKLRTSRPFRDIKQWAGTLIVLSPVPWKELDIVEHEGLWDYWVYDSNGKCLPEGLMELA